MIGMIFTQRFLNGSKCKFSYIDPLLISYFSCALFCVCYLCCVLSYLDVTCLMQRERYRLRVRASDRGEPPLYADVDVELDVVDRNNKPPLWDQSVYAPIRIKENVTVGTVVTSMKARLVFQSLAHPLALMPFNRSL